jgi:DNA-directed RNA polymerase specialized sigma24 family protein
LRLAQDPIDESTPDALSLTAEERIVERTVVMTAITEALEAMTPTERRVFEKWCFEDLEPRQISEAFGVSDEAVRTALYRAKQRLKPYLHAIDETEGTVRRRSPKGTSNDDTLRTTRRICDQPCDQYPDCRCASGY